MAKPATVEELDEVKEALEAQISTVKKSVETNQTREQKNASDLRGLIDGLKVEQKQLQDQCKVLAEKVNKRATDLEDNVNKVVALIDGKVVDFERTLSEMDEKQQKEIKKISALDKKVQKELDRVTKLTESATTMIFARMEGYIAEIKERIDFVNEAMQTGCRNWEERSQQLYDRHAVNLLDWGKDLQQRVELKIDEWRKRLDEELADTHNVCTRRVEWTINEADRVLGSKRTAQLFSPEFSAGGCGPLRLEIRMHRLRSAAEIEKLEKEKEDAGFQVSSQPSDCSIFLWAPKGVNLVWTLGVGKGGKGKDDSLKKQFEHNFLAPMSAGGGLVFEYNQYVDWTLDNISVFCDVLEVRRDIDLIKINRNSSLEQLPAEYCDVDFEPSFENEESLTQSLIATRYISHRILDQVRRHMDDMKNRHVKKVEWKIENISEIVENYSQGRHLQSCLFAMAGLDQLQLIFYPAGYLGASDGYCSLFLSAPSGSYIKANLFVGKQQRPVNFDFTERGAFGRTNFCLIETQIGGGHDSLVVGMEVVEAKQDLKASFISGNVKNSVKLQRALDGKSLVGVREVHTDDQGQSGMLVLPYTQKGKGETPQNVKVLKKQQPVKHTPSLPPVH